MNKLYYIIVSVILIFCQSCSSGPSTTDKNQTTVAEDIKDTQTVAEKPSSSETNNGYGVKIHNERFGFTFNLPKGWKAEDKSSNKDGFFINTGNTETDIRVYGTHTDDLLGDDSPDCVEENSVTAADGGIIVHCIAGEEEYYFRNGSENKVTFYIKAGNSWKEENRERIEALAKSISFGPIM